MVSSRKSREQKEKSGKGTYHGQKNIRKTPIMPPDSNTNLIINFKYI